MQKEHYDVNGLLLFLDFQKAFDSVNWNFMIETLKRFNFGSNFVKWVNTLYYNANTCVKIMGIYQNPLICAGV